MIGLEGQQLERCFAKALECPWPISPRVVSHKTTWIATRPPQPYVKPMSYWCQMYVYSIHWYVYIVAHHCFMFVGMLFGLRGLATYSISGEIYNSPQSRWFATLGSFFHIRLSSLDVIAKNAMVVFFFCLQIGVQNCPQYTQIRTECALLGPSSSVGCPISFIFTMSSPRSQSPSSHHCAARWMRIARLRRRGTRPRPQRPNRFSTRWRHGVTPNHPVETNEIAGHHGHHVSYVCILRKLSIYPKSSTDL